MCDVRDWSIIMRLLSLTHLVIHRHRRCLLLAVGKGGQQGLVMARVERVRLVRMRGESGRLVWLDRPHSKLGLVVVGLWLLNFHLLEEDRHIFEVAPARGLLRLRRGSCSLFALYSKLLWLTRLLDHRCFLFRLIIFLVSAVSWLCQSTYSSLLTMFEKVWATVQ